MLPYEFEPGSAELNLQSNGYWIANFDASAYNDQVFDEISNSIGPDGIRVIEFEVIGNETGSVSYHSGSSTTYSRGNEGAVQLVLYKGGDKKGHTTIYYP